MRSLEKREKILVGVLSLVVLYFLYDAQYFSGSAVLKPDENTTETQTTGQLEDPADFRKYTRVELASLVSVEGDWQNDPFFYTTAEDIKDTGGQISQIFGQVLAEGSQGFSLEGISWLGNSGYAIINSNILKETDKIGGHEVVKISAKYVILKQGTKTIRLTINE